MSSFRVRSGLASTYRQGPVFLVGDAAHVHSPIGGQGMNGGIHDAVNLAWKLADVLAGGPDALLDTYELERRPAARGIVATTERLTRLGVIGGATGQVLRQYVLPFVLGLPPVRERIGRGTSGLALSYKRSPLSATGGGARAPFERGFYRECWELFRDRGSSRVLVRPDGYIAGRFSDDGPELARYQARWLGNHPPVADGRTLPRH